MLQGAKKNFFWKKRIFEIPVGFLTRNSSRVAFILLSFPPFLPPPPLPLVIIWKKFSPPPLFSSSFPPSSLSPHNVPLLVAGKNGSFSREGKKERKRRKERGKILLSRNNFPLLLSKKCLVGSCSLNYTYSTTHTNGATKENKKTFLDVAIRNFLLFPPVEGGRCLCALFGREREAIRSMPPSPITGDWKKKKKGRNSCSISSSSPPPQKKSFFLPSRKSEGDFSLFLRRRRMEGCILPLPLLLLLVPQRVKEEEEEEVEEDEDGGWDFMGREGNYCSASEKVPSDRRHLHRYLRIFSSNLILLLVYKF